MSPIPFRALFCRPSSSKSLRTAVAAALLAGLSACDKGTPPAAPADKAPEAAAGDKAPAAGAQAPAKPAEPSVVTVLVTGGLGGQLVPAGEEGQTQGGAAETLGRWVAEDKHCAGPVKADGQASCPDSTTLALATGDHWNGPALSSFFLGEPTAAVMARMGYAASALGNHELDYGREQFLKNAGIGQFSFLAANLKVKDAAVAKGMDLPAFKVFDRKGLKIGVVGLTSPKTVTSAMAGRAEGLDLVGTEEALASAIPEARKAGADVVVVVADMCPTELQPTLEKHPDWKLALVAGGRCQTQIDTKVGDTQVVSLGRGLEKFLRARITFDPSKPAGEKVTAMEAKLVDVAGAGGTPDAEAAKIIADAKTQLEPKLGEQIGFTKKGIKQGTPEMTRWVAGSMRESIKADAVVLNRKGVRQDLPAGPITMGSIYSVLPYENSLMLVKVKGADLATQLANPEAFVSGFTAAGKGKFKDAKGKPLDPKKEYTVGTVEYLYFGGDGFEFEKLDPDPKETGMAWQTPVAEWTRNQKSTEARPLEKSLPK
ncbi:bifunctional metallophosphatase/5'-nucleotidase [Hyalangium gracile]|uniref:bifunctional metallophosphatase/5'-nucleotidase n=1 Tax=Hyalangium gracile TaxID=394092 RepID=UPI001CC96761|nr:5'-nucleotidase C-terminal domain-containing protein [Hyalangium gracile]